MVDIGEYTMNCVLQGEDVDRKKRQIYIEIIDPKKISGCV
jgi:hypothetical protein